MMQKRWTIASCDTELVAHLSTALKIHPITATILTLRGITNISTAERFLSPRLSHLPDPFGLLDMEKAIDRTLAAIKKKEKIVVFGDYDADGITSAALLVSFFKECGITAGYYLPNRISEGFGLSKTGIDKIKELGATLIITTDNGSSCHSEIAYAISLGIDVIVTDHHEILETLPPASAVINPKRQGSNPEFSELAGVGVAFYFALALRAKLRRLKHFDLKEPDMKNYLDLVALGTIADVAPLTGINRILVKHGIEVLRKTVRPGLRALASVAATDLAEIDTHGIAFRLAPRINAAGRLGDQNVGIELLLTSSETEAGEIAACLNQMNSERQSIEKKILENTTELMQDLGTARASIVLCSQEWHSGIIGIVASRLSETYRKPCALICVDGNNGRGSVRSVADFNIMETLNSCSHTLKNFGGHKAAAGFDIDTTKIDEFRDSFEAHIVKNLSEDDCTPNIKIDAEVDIGEMNADLVRELDQLSPFGEANHMPVFATKPCAIKNARTVGNNHLKLTIKHKNSFIDAIGFGLAGQDIDTTKKYQLAGTPQFNIWNGNTSIQMKLKDIKVE